MGYIKEPEGVEFEVIPQNKRDIETDRLFSEFLAKYRSKNKKARAKIVARAMEIIQKYDESQPILLEKSNKVIKKCYFKEEPTDIDFEVQPSYLNPLTPEEASEFLEFLSEYKLKKKTREKGSDKNRQ